MTTIQKYEDKSIMITMEDPTCTIHADEIKIDKTDNYAVIYAYKNGNYVAMITSMKDEVELIVFDDEE